MLSHKLEAGTAVGENIGVLLPNSAGVAVVLMALQTIGRVPAMLNFSAGAVSVLAASSVAAVIHRALAGRFDDARRLLAEIGTGQPGGGGAEPGPSQPRRFTLAAVVSLIEGAGLRAGPAHGVRVFADLVPGMFADADPGAADALLALEQAASAHPAFHYIATQFHIVGYR